MEGGRQMEGNGGGDGGTRDKMGQDGVGTGESEGGETVVSM